MGCHLLIDKSARVCSGCCPLTLYPGTGVFRVLATDPVPGYGGGTDKCCLSVFMKSVWWYFWFCIHYNSSCFCFTARPLAVAIDHVTTNSTP